MKNILQGLRKNKTDEVKEALFAKNAKPAFWDLETLHCQNLLNGINDAKLIEENVLSDEVLKNLYNNTAKSVLRSPAQALIALRWDKLANADMLSNSQLFSTQFQGYDKTIILFSQTSYVTINTSGLDKILKQVRAEYKKDSKQYNGALVEQYNNSFKVKQKLVQVLTKPEGQKNIVLQVAKNEYAFYNPQTRNLSESYISNTLPVLKNGFFLLKNNGGCRFYKDQDGTVSETYTDALPFMKIGDKGQLTTFVKDRANNKIIDKSWFKIDTTFTPIAGMEGSALPIHYRKVNGTDEFITYKVNETSKYWNYIVVSTGRDSKISDIDTKYTDAEVLPNSGVLKLTQPNNQVVYVDYIGRTLSKEDMLSGVYLYRYKENQPLTGLNPVTLEEIPAEYFVGKNDADKSGTMFVNELARIYLERKTNELTQKYSGKNPKKGGAGTKDVGEIIEYFTNLVNNKKAEASKSNNKPQTTDTSLQALLLEFKNKMAQFLPQETATTNAAPTQTESTATPQAESNAAPTQTENNANPQAEGKANKKNKKGDDNAKSPTKTEDDGFTITESSEGKAEAEEEMDEKVFTPTVNDGFTITKENTNYAVNVTNQDKLVEALKGLKSISIPSIIGKYGCGYTKAKALLQYLADNTIVEKVGREYKLCDGLHPGDGDDGRKA